MKIRDELKWVVPIVVACVLVFANSLGGEFVYDDMRQILRNALIQDNTLFWTALTSDVWAFKGDATVAASNYWRPTFTAWHIINFKLFGSEPFGWHVLNVLLHTGVCVLAFLLLRRWAFSVMSALAITLIFAVHPVHSESVAWISGSPDVLFALAFLGSLWFFQSFTESRSSHHLGLAVVFYAVALGAKEIGIVCLPIYYFMLMRDPAETDDGEPQKGKKKRRKAGDNNTPLAILAGTAVAYFLIRWSILGAVSRPPDDAVSMGDAILSVPAMFAFYLRQVFFPYWMSINYPLSPVSQIGLTTFVFPLAISLMALGGVIYLALRGARERIAAGLFLLPLIPAMNAMAFPTEHMVHDRYLYLPLLGILMLLVPLATKLVNERYVLAAAGVVSVVLGIQTFLYNRSWENEITLWSAAKTVDDSAFTSTQYGSALADLERFDESISAYTDAIKKRPGARGYLGRARALLRLKRYPEAESDLKAALDLPLESTDLYTLYQTYEALGIVYNDQRKYAEAARTFVEAREKLPIYAASLTVKLAIVLYQSNQKDQALSELEQWKAQAAREMLPESKSLYLRLGMLYAQQNRNEEARREIVEFLNTTSTYNDKKILAERVQAAKFLESLK